MKDDLSDPFAEPLRSYYLEAALSDERVGEILANAREHRVKSVRRRWLVGLAAALGTVAIAIPILHPIWQQKVLSKRVAAEVVFNFHKSRTDNIKLTTEYEDLDRLLPELDFTIVELPERIVVGATLVGGRYCSLMDVLAAQIRIERLKDGRSGTLYVSRRTAPLDEVTEGKVRVGDFVVEMWTDDTRFFALMYELTQRAGQGESIYIHDP